jgi:hypothetical protein
MTIWKNILSLGLFSYFQWRKLRREEAVAKAEKRQADMVEVRRALEKKIEKKRGK